MKSRTAKKKNGVLPRRKAAKGERSAERTPESAAEAMAPAPRNAEKLRILIVDDHPMIRCGLGQTVAREFDAEIGEATNAQEAIDKIFAERWDVILLDVAMPGRSGMDVLKEVKQMNRRPAVLVLSVHSEDQLAIRVLQNGASGYLTKETPEAEIVAAIKQILTGRKYIRPSIAEKLAGYLDRDATQALHAALSNREYQVMCMIASGKMVKEIGAELSLSIKTVSTYRRRILEKMCIKNNSELMRYAVEHDLIEFPRHS